jgi:hypothetical protein
MRIRSLLQLRRKKKTRREEEEGMKAHLAQRECGSDLC